MDSRSILRATIACSHFIVITDIQNMNLYSFTFSEHQYLLISERNKSSNRICQACNINKIGVTQYRCGHIVCSGCAPAKRASGERRYCKICGQEVESTTAYDSTALWTVHSFWLFFFLMIYSICICVFYVPLVQIIILVRNIK